MDILKFTESPMTDECIEEYEFHEYEPVTGTNLNNPGEIRINIETQDANLLHERNKYKYYKQLFTERLENKDIRCIHLKEGKRKRMWQPF